MTNSNVLINFVLDQSGSMTSVHRPTIDGINTFMAEQRKQPGTALLTLTKFSTRFETVHTALDLQEWHSWGSQNYSPQGGTALLDAVGECIKATENWLATNSFDGKVVCVILTDGQENSSKVWHINQPAEENDPYDVAQLIRYKQDVDGWEFVFLGSGGTEWLERTFGHVVSGDRFTAYAGQHTNSTYAATSASLSRSRAASAAGQSVDFLVDEKAITDDAESRQS